MSRFSSYLEKEKQDCKCHHVNRSAEKSWIPKFYVEIKIGESEDVGLSVYLEGENLEDVKQLLRPNTGWSMLPQLVCGKKEEGVEHH